MLEELEAENEEIMRENEILEEKIQELSSGGS